MHAEKGKPQDRLLKDRTAPGDASAMHVLRLTGRLALLLTVLAVLGAVQAIPTASAQDTQPACSDGVDNDGDNAIDGADAGCGDGNDNDETDSPYSGIKYVTVALPLVTLQGTVNARGVVKVSKLRITAKPGSKVTIRCSGKSCPFKRGKRIMITKNLRLKPFERRLRPSLRFSLAITYPDSLGKLVQYKVRRKGPVRIDKCLVENETSPNAVQDCYQ